MRCFLLPSRQTCTSFSHEDGIIFIVIVFANKTKVAEHRAVHCYKSTPLPVEATIIY